MSRVEDILKGTYTGRPLSRVEYLLQNGGTGSGSGASATSVNDDQYNDIMEKLEARNELTSEELTAMWGND